MSRKEKKEFEAIPNGTPMNVKFHIGDIKCSTRSSFTTEEDAVSNLNILVYRAGELITSAYTEDVDESVIILRLAKGEQYNLYALANCGEVSLKTESELLAYQYTIPSLSSLNNGYPMCWSRTDFTISTIVPDVSIELERLVAKVSFSLDPGVLDGLEVTSVRLMQSSKVISPFGLDRAAASSSQVMAGDYASATDLTQLNNGGSIIMYVPENCQGTLLEGNTDPWGKTPDNISKGDVCTYIEVGCSFNEGFALSGDVIYRMYLGNDNCANFDVVRNSIYNISLLLTGDGLNEVSWKVDSDVDYTGKNLILTIKSGLRDMSQIYIGETTKFQIGIPESLNKIIDLETCQIIASSTSSSLTASSNIYISDITKENESYTVELTGVTASSLLHLLLVDKNNKIIGEFSDGKESGITVLKGHLRFSNTNSSYTTAVPALTSNLTTENRFANCMTVNKSAGHTYIYITDSDGIPLNTTGCYRFNLSYYEDLSISPDGDIISDSSLTQKERNNLTNSLRTSITSLIHHSNSPNEKFPSTNKACFDLENSINHSGQDASVCDALSKICSTMLTGLEPQISYNLTAANANTATIKDYIGIVPVEVVRLPLCSHSEDIPFAHPDIRYKNAIGIYNPSMITVRYYEGLIGCDHQKIYCSSVSSNQTASYIIGPHPNRYGDSYIYYRMSHFSSKCTPYLASDGYVTILTRDDGREYLYYSFDDMSNKESGPLGGAISGKCITTSQKYDDNISVCSLSNRSVIEDDQQSLKWYYQDWSEKCDHCDACDVWYDGFKNAEIHFNYAWRDKTTTLASFDGFGNAIGNSHSIDIKISDIERLTSTEYISAQLELSNTSGLSLILKENGNIASNTLDISIDIIFKAELTGLRGSSLFGGNKALTNKVDSNIPGVNDFSVTLTPGSKKTISLLDMNTIKRAILYINHSYWLASTANVNYYDDGTGILRRNSRYSKFAKPYEVSAILTIKNGTRWSKVTLSSASLSSIDVSSIGTFYDRTEEGYYAAAENITTNWAYAFNNPDGTSRTYGGISNGMPATNAVVVPAYGNATTNTSHIITRSISSIPYLSSLDGTPKMVIYHKEY